MKFPAAKPRRKPPPKWMTGPDRNAEARIQAAVVAYLRIIAPHLIVAAVKNESQNPARAVWTGVYPGFTDLILIDEHGLSYFIEIKTVDGVLSEEQKEFRDLCRARRYPWALVRNVNDAKAALSAFGIKTREAASSPLT